jgi:hypothetical protein
MRTFYCFADRKHAEKFRKRFGGAGFNPKARGRGSSWARIYLEHFWNDFAADHNKSVSERDRQIYARAYAQPGAMQKFSQNFEWGATDFASFAKTKLAMPMLVLPGEKAGGQFVIDQGRVSCLP